VNVASSEQGADVPPNGIFRNTALGSSYYFDGFTERLLYVNTSLANNALATGLSGASFGAELRLVSVNDSRYGGGGAFGGYAVFAGGNGAAREIALHELGHSFNLLADEYGGATSRFGGPEPSAVNVTKDPTGAKWARWLGYSEPSFGKIDAYEGAQYYDAGLFRPSENSKMRSLDRPFDAISREKIILDIYGLVDPLDSWLDNIGLLVDPAFLSVSVVDPAVIKTNWYVNGELVAGAEGETFRLNDYGFGPGHYLVTARAFDPTDWVRINLDQLEESITWDVLQTTPEPITLLLWGTTMAGLGLAARRRRRSQN
jgi:hypothetical protein